MLRFFYISASLIVLLIHSGKCQQKIEKEISYISDLAFNLRGGYESGYSWLGCFQASINFDFEQLNLWKNGNLQFSYISTHGRSFSQLTGDIQVVSNIEAGQLATTMECWYQHKINDFEITLGLIDLNAFFSYCEPALSLINSSFGIQPTISGNMPVPIFPVTSLGGVVSFRIDGETDISLGVFDGTPSIYGDFQFMPEFTWNAQEGILFCAEVNRKYQIGSSPGLVKAGYWMHTLNMSSHHSGEYSANHGFYIIGEQEIFGKNSKNLDAWAKFGGAPRDCNVIRYFNGAGVTFSNYAKQAIINALSVGMGQAIFCHQYRKAHLGAWHETVVEVTAKKEVGILTVQPDIQYIINPSGNRETGNPFCVIIRTQISI